MRGRLLTLVALVLAGWALWVLEGARAGLKIEELRYGETPVTLYYTGVDGPDVVIAHGFAGSRQMMQGYALVLAQAGYTVHAFDFEGHGMHARPMGGDVTALDGTTQRLVAQTRAVIDRVAGDAPVALLGHSMATDVLVRAAADDPRVGPVVLLSAFSRAITATHPQSLLLITGAWEPGLTDFALEAAQMVQVPWLEMVRPQAQVLALLPVKVLRQCRYLYGICCTTFRIHQRQEHSVVHCSRSQ